MPGPSRREQRVRDAPEGGRARLRQRSLGVHVSARSSDGQNGTAYLICRRGMVHLEVDVATEVASAVRAKFR